MSVEQLAIDRLLKLFGADHANVQPHSGAQANMAVFLAALQPGDTILAMDLAHGGHLTHGMQLNFSGKYFKASATASRRTRTGSTSTRSRGWPASTSRSWSSPGPVPTRG